jgi:hypothetical protein
MQNGGVIATNDAANFRGALTALGMVADAPPELVTGSGHSAASAATA